MYKYGGCSRARTGTCHHLGTPCSAEERQRQRQQQQQWCQGRVSNSPHAEVPRPGARCPLFHINTSDTNNCLGCSCFCYIYIVGFNRPSQYTVEPALWKAGTGAAYRADVGAQVSLVAAWVAAPSRSLPNVRKMAELPVVRGYPGARDDLQEAQAGRQTGAVTYWTVHRTFRQVRHWCVCFVSVSLISPDLFKDYDHRPATWARPRMGAHTRRMVRLELFVSTECNQVFLELLLYQK